MQQSRVLSEYPLSLGEGAFYEKSSHRAFWVDIMASNIYVCVLGSWGVQRYFVDGNPSVIFDVRGDIVFYTDRFGLKTLDLSSGAVSSIRVHPEHIPSEFRANDGVRLDGARVLYGTMRDEPEKGPGKIYLYNDDSKKIFLFHLGIYIPNSFIVLDDGVLISDSYNKIIYKVVIENNDIVECSLWKDYSRSSYTPDGGCLSQKGAIHIALWDGKKIVVLDSQGKELSHIPLPFSRPTNCAFLDGNNLLVTSAENEGGLSGKTIVLDLGESYEF